MDIDSILKIVIALLTILSTLLSIYKISLETKKISRNRAHGVSNFEMEENLLESDESHLGYHKETHFKRYLPWVFLFLGLLSIIPTCIFGMQIIGMSQSIFCWLAKSNDHFLVNYLYYSAISIISIYILVTFFLLSKSKITILVIIISILVLVYSMKMAFNNYYEIYNLFHKYSEQAKEKYLYYKYNRLVYSIVISSISFYFILFFFYLQNILRSNTFDIFTKRG